MTSDASRPSTACTKALLTSPRLRSAPFPMWYRGADLSLGLVNSAFVQAVEGRDASEVIQRGAELIDAEGADSPRAQAKEAQSSGRIVSRMQPAIIRGERRMLR